MRRRWGLKLEKVGSIRELIKLVRALTIDDVEMYQNVKHTFGYADGRAFVFVHQTHCFVTFSLTSLSLRRVLC